MELSVSFHPERVPEKLFLVLLVCVAISRLAELWISRKHQKQMSARGVEKLPDARFPAMVALHVAVLGGAAVEVVWLHRPFIPVLAAVAGFFLVSATALRWWVIRSLGAHWNVQVMDSARLGVVSNGPFRWVRHPNYLAVFVEMAALPLIHTAWITSAIAMIGNILLLRSRLRLEEGVLQSYPEYQLAMAGKARFLPRIF
jgi:methyltransferase